MGRVVHDRERILNSALTGLDEIAMITPQLKIKRRVYVGVPRLQRRRFVTAYGDPHTLRDELAPSRTQIFGARELHDGSYAVRDNEVPDCLSVPASLSSLLYFVTQ